MLVYSLIMYFWVVIGTFFGTCLLGWLVHWSFHQKWSGFFYRGHYNHHFKQYPSNDMFSDIYRSAGLDSSGIWMPVIFSPLIGLLIYGMIVGWLSWVMGLMILATALITGWLHSYIHDATHLKKHWLQIIPWFANLVELHIQHHRNINSNLGIFFFGFDRLFNTFEKKQKVANFD